MTTPSTEGRLTPLSRAILADMMRRFEAELGPEAWAAERAEVDALVAESRAIARQDAERRQSGG